MTTAAPTMTTAAPKPSQIHRRARRIPAATRSDSGIVAMAASTAATASPAGTTVSKPALGPATTTVGVARAWSPSPAAATANAKASRKSRASARFPAASAAAAATIVPPSAAMLTIQKWSRCSCQISSRDGRASSAAASTRGRSATNHNTGRRRA